MKKSLGIITSLLLIGFFACSTFGRQNITKRDIKPAQPAQPIQPAKPAEKVGFLWIRVTIVFHLGNKNE